MTPIPFIEFAQRIAQVYPDVRGQVIAPAPRVHVFDEAWFRDTFWIYFGDVKREINSKLPTKPLQNNARRGICDELTKRLIAELTLCTRVAHNDEDVGPGAVEATVDIAPGAMLNRVPSGLHRCAIVALTKDHVVWRPVFIEPQLDYANFETTDLLDAAGHGHQLVEHWV